MSSYRFPIRVQEGKTAVAVCPVGLLVDGIGDPVFGQMEGGRACNATGSYSVVCDRCLGRSSCTVPATTRLFGDPVRAVALEVHTRRVEPGCCIEAAVSVAWPSLQCPGTFKYLEFAITCTEPASLFSQGTECTFGVCYDSTVGEVTSLSAPSSEDKTATGVVAVLLPGHSWERDSSVQARRLAATISGFADAMLVVGQPLVPDSTLALVPHNITWHADAAATLNEAADVLAAKWQSARWLFVAKGDEEIWLDSSTDAATLMAQLEATRKPMALCSDNSGQTARVGLVRAPVCRS